MLLGPGVAAARAGPIVWIDPSIAAGAACDDPCVVTAGAARWVKHVGK